jgi:hypothetical protein
MNPSYYDLDSVDHETVNKYLSTVVQGSIGELERSSCLEVDEVRGVYVYFSLLVACTAILRCNSISIPFQLRPC